VRRARYLTALLGCLCLPASAQAAQVVELDATLTPERLGQGATIGFGFHITTTTHGVPSPLTGVAVSNPNNLGIALSGLGLATCTEMTLEHSGAEGCPADSIMGYGTVHAELPIGRNIIDEAGSVTLVRGPSQNGHLAVLFYTNAETPVSSQIVLPALLLPTPAPYGGRISITVPLIEGLPEGPDVTVTQLSSTLGPQNVTYYETVRGHRVAYHPNGILLPDHCPHGGFPFAAELHFADGSRTLTRTSVPCPKSAR
jgi:hypothetical protein